MKKSNKSIFKILIILSLTIFISGCYTIVHPPFTVKEKVTKVIIKEKDTEENIEYEENNIDEEIIEETHIYYHYYEPFYDWDYYSRWHPLWHRHYNGFYPDFAIVLNFHSHRFPWIHGFYFYEPWYYPDIFMSSQLYFGCWNYYPRYIGYAHYPYYDYGRYYRYYRDYDRISKPYKKRDFGRRQNYRVSTANNNRIQRTDESIQKTGENNSNRKTADSYKGRRTRRDEYTGTKSVKKPANSNKQTAERRTKRTENIRKSTNSDKKSSASRTKRTENIKKPTRAKPRSSVSTRSSSSRKRVIRSSSGRGSSRSPSVSTRSGSSRSGSKPSGSSTKGNRREKR